MALWVKLELTGMVIVIKNKYESHEKLIAPSGQTVVAGKGILSLTL